MAMMFAMTAVWMAKIRRARYVMNRDFHFSLERAPERIFIPDCFALCQIYEEAQRRGFAAFFFAEAEEKSAKDFP